jgi:hypothetical protein
MSKVTFRIVEHDYKVGDVFSKAFPSHAAAITVAERAAAEQRLPGDTVSMEREEKGVWHEELDPGDDRPETSVDDKEE